MRSSFIALAFTLALGCGRDPLIGVPAGPQAGTGGSGGSGGSPVPGGSGGAPATGGAAGGTIGTGGAAGRPMVDAAPNPPPTRDAAVPPPPDAAPAACAAVPQCLARLTTMCPTAAPCTTARLANGTVNQCYPNNNNNSVKLSITVAGQVTTVTVARNGMQCYTLTATQGRGGGGMGGQAVTNLVYNDGPNTPTIATGTLQGAGTVTLMCAGAGQMPVGPVQVACAPGGTALAGLAGGMAGNACTNGMCTP